MSGDRTPPEGRSGRGRGRGIGSPHGRGRGRGRGSVGYQAFCSLVRSVNLDPVASYGKPSIYREVGPSISSSIEYKKKGSNDVNGPERDFEVSSGKPSMYREAQSSIFCSIDHGKKGRSDVKGPESDSVVSYGKSFMYGEDRASRASCEYRNKSRQGLEQWQTSSEMGTGSRNVRRPEWEPEVSSGRSWEDRSSRSTTECWNRSPQRPNLRQISSDIAKGSSNDSGPKLDFEVSSGKSPIYRDDWSSRSSFIDERIKSPQNINVRGPVSDFELCTFDICRTESKVPVTLNKSLLEVNREKRREREHRKHESHVKYLRSGMILLKNYIGHNDQVRIIRSCRKLGIGVGGFYRPGYGDGAKLHLQMMCLGKNWDPESRLYEDKRPSDGAKPPPIPDDFRKLVAGAIQTAYDFLQLKNKGINVEDELPWMSPDFCIVNFYSNSGKLGLHQDRDESEESIHKGLPIVSFSLGDSAEFLYGDKRDVDIAEKVVLESGDILIFGGKSRLLFHGVSSIIPNTAPKSLIDDTKLKPGHLNLTFRQ